MPAINWNAARMCPATEMDDNICPVRGLELIRVGPVCVRLMRTQLERRDGAGAARGCERTVAVDGKDSWDEDVYVDMGMGMHICRRR